MRSAKIALCAVQCLLVLLILVPLTHALEQERALPDPAVPSRSQGGISAPAPSPTMEDVWLQNGGARLYYSALYGARQQYMGGASRLDPACSPLLPPMRAWGAPEPKKKIAVRSRKVAAANPCPEVPKAGVASSGPAQSTAKDSVQAAPKATPKAPAPAAKASAAAAAAAKAKVSAAKPAGAPPKAAAAVTDTKGVKNGAAATAKPLNTTPKPDLPVGPQ